MLLTSLSYSSSLPSGLNRRFRGVLTFDLKTHNYYFLSFCFCLTLSNQNGLPETENQQLFDATIAKVNNTVDLKNVLFPGCKVNVDLKSIAKHQVLSMALGGLKDHFFAGGYYCTINPNHPNYFAMIVDATLSYWYCVPLCALTRELSLALPLDSLSRVVQFLSSHSADIQNSSPSDLYEKDEGDELSEHGQPIKKPKSAKKKQLRTSSVAPPKPTSAKSGHFLRPRTPRVVPTAAASSRYQFLFIILLLSFYIFKELFMMHVSPIAAGCTAAKKKSENAKKAKAPKARKRTTQGEAAGMSVNKQEGGRPAAPKAKNKQKRNLPQKVKFLKGFLAGCRLLSLVIISFFSFRI
jgi:hypothetical protein